MAIKATAQQTLIDVTDAYSVMLTSETYTFPGGTSGAPSGAKCRTEVMAFCGTNQCSKVTVDQADIVCPSGITAAVENSGTSAPRITFTLTATLAQAAEATIPVVVDGLTFNKKFSFAVAKQGNTGATGAAGVSVTGVTTYYLVSPNNTGITTSTEGWSTTPKTTDTTNKYLWMYQKYTYSSGNPTTTTPTIIGTHGATGSTGATGAAGNGVKSVTNYFLVSSKSSGVTVSDSGWTTTPQTTTTTNKYLWCYQKFDYTNGSSTKTTPTIIGTHGATGATGPAGADAIAMSITSSAGTIFKNNSGSTVLTAHVFKGGVEQTITDAGVCGSLGTVKWYKNGGASPVATAKSVTVTASEVTNSVVYEARLE